MYIYPNSQSDEIRRLMESADYFAHMYQSTAAMLDACEKELDLERHKHWGTRIAGILSSAVFGIVIGCLLAGRM